VPIARPGPSGVSYGPVGTTPAPTQTSYPTPSQPVAGNYPQWEYDLLQTLGIQPSPVNLQFLNLWAASEGVAATNNNPLAITDPSNQFPHSGVVAPNGGDPVYAFPTEAVGVQATASFLQHGYGAVIQAMKSSSLSSMWQAINQSAWCSGCQGGQYPVAVYQALQGNAPGTIFQGGQTGQGVQQATNNAPSYGCSSKGNGVTVPVIPFVYSQTLPIGTPCQLKALLGGLLVGVGSVFVLVGGILVVAQGLSGTRAGRAATQLASGRGPVGTVARAPVRAARAVRGAAQSRRDSALERNYLRNRDTIRERNARYRAQERAAQRAGAPPRAEEPF
jgi:hypothetical protein